MNIRQQFRNVRVIGIMLASGLAAPLYASNGKPGLDEIIPEDILLFTVERYNPEKDFIHGYWEEVFEALKKTGVGNDFMDLLASFVDQTQLREIERIKERAAQLLEGVDWDKLCKEEMVFAERLPLPQHSHGGVYMGPPDMVWLFRGSEAGTAHNFNGLVAILQAITEEINNVAEAEVLTLEQGARRGAEIASINLLAAVPEAPQITLGVARRGNIIFINLGEHLASDVLALLDGTSSKKPLAANARYRAAFEDLPLPEDSKVFFDWRAFLSPMLEMTRMTMALIESPHDVVHNTEMEQEVAKLHRQSLVAYHKRDYAEALRLTQEAYKQDQDNSIILYNLACFSALTSEKQEAIEWLQKSVESGFWAPTKIAADPDLERLRDAAGYKAAHGQAVALAREAHVEDVVINSTKSGEAYSLSEQAWDAYDRKEHEQGLSLVQQAYEIAPKDSRVLYYLSCFHAVLGHKEKALNFLNKAVDGGFYCPRHISRDPDLDSIRSTEGYERAHAKARQKAIELSQNEGQEKLALGRAIVHRAMDAVGVLDYIAEVSSTDGYTVKSECIVAMVPQAPERPIYRVIGAPRPLQDFDRFLPKETLSFSVNRGINPGTLYDYVEDTLREGGPKGKALLTKWNELQDKFGLNVREDVLAWIEGQCVNVTLEDHLGSVMMIRVTDADKAKEKVSAALDYITAKMTEFIAKVPMIAMFMPTRTPIEEGSLKGFEKISISISPATPVAWGVAQGYLIGGTSTRAIKLCLDTAHGEHPGIRENKRLMSEALIPQEPCTSVTLTDYRNMGEELAMICGFVPMIVGSATMQIDDPQAKLVIGKVSGMIAKLPPALRKIDFYKSMASYTTYDGQAWHSYQVTNYFSPEERADRAKAMQTADEATEGL